MKDLLRSGARKDLELRKAAPNYGALKPMLSARAADELAATSAGAAAARKHAVARPLAVKLPPPRQQLLITKEAYAYKGLGREPSPPFGIVG